MSDRRSMSCLDPESEGFCSGRTAAVGLILESVAKPLSILSEL